MGHECCLRRNALISKTNFLRLILIATGGSVVFQRKPITMAPSFDIKHYFRSISAHEFIDLYCKYEASGRRGTDSFKYTGTTLLHNSGHRLNRRTVACHKRIIQVSFFSFPTIVSYLSNCGYGCGRASISCI